MEDHYKLMQLVVKIAVDIPREGLFFVQCDTKVPDKG